MSLRLLLFLSFLFCLAASCASHAAEETIPRLILIGDSTVRCGSGHGEGGQWGWGQVLPAHFDTARIFIENRAIGGRSSRTFLTEGRWEKALQRVRPGDFVLMQFGHNDGGKMFDTDRPRASIKGNGDETKEGIVEATGKQETVHSYGWYLRKYIADTLAKGATPIVLSLVPRNRWEGDSVIRADRDYGKWAAEAARQGGAQFIDLNDFVAKRYEKMGQSRVARDLFLKTDWTHTVQAGAKINAECVVAGIRGLSDCQLKDFLLPQQETEPTQPTSWKFDFGDRRADSACLQVLPSTQYSAEQGFGFEPNTAVESTKREISDAALQDALTSDKPFYFSAALPEGNYRVRVVGGKQPLTVKAELRRLMPTFDQVDENGLYHGEFSVNIRTPAIPGEKAVGLKPRELKEEWRAWDEKLTLEFNGPQPCVSSLTIEPEPNAITVFLAGDSTVTDQPREPWNSWGQMLTHFFQPGVAVANCAQSGESVRSSIGARRFKKIFSLMKPGDYLFIQFGHNDMKSKSPDALASYRENLDRLVNQTKDLGGNPVLVTSMERKAGVKQPTLESYPNAVREIAAQNDVPLIDLHAMSIQLYRALGNDLGRAFQDGTHHNSYGSYLLAKCVVQGILDNGLPLSELVVESFADFDPNEPDDVENFSIPASPRRSFAKPDGN